MYLLFAWEFCVYALCLFIFWLVHHFSTWWIKHFKFRKISFACHFVLLTYFSGMSFVYGSYFNSEDLNFYCSKSYRPFLIWISFNYITCCSFHVYRCYASTILPVVLCISVKPSLYFLERPSNTELLTQHQSVE